MITQRAILVGIVGFCFYLIAIVNELPVVFYALTWLTVSILFSSLGIALVSLVGIECKWKVIGTRVSQSRVVAGQTVAAPAVTGRAKAPSTPGALQDIGISGPQLMVEFTNRGTLSKTSVILEVQLQAVGREGMVPRRFLLEALPTGTALSSSLELSDLPRGRYRVKALRLIGADVLGLFRVQRVIGPSYEIPASGPHEDDIIIGPALVAFNASVPEGEGGNSIGVGVAQRYLGNSDELRGTRPYVAGDDLRRVHWKSTARLGDLVVKEFHRTTQSQTIVIWDGAAETTWGTEPATTTEFALCLVASLCRMLVEQGKPCGLLRLDTHPALIATAGANTRLAGGQLLGRVTEALAEAQADRSGPISYELTAHLAGLSAGSNILLVTASLAPDLREAVLACVDRGARVRVGLLQGAAFRERVEGRRGAGPITALGWHPRQHWTAGPDGKVLAGERPVTTESYENHVAMLRDSGIAVTLLDPVARNLTGEAAVRRMLHEFIMPGSLFDELATVAQHEPALAASAA